MTNFGIAIHGGAGSFSQKSMTPEKAKAHETVIKQAYDAGYAILANGGTSVEAVKGAIVVLEDSPLFNAGKGSVYTNQGHVEMDAAIMNGKDLNAGSVAGVSLVKNPILLAEKVLTESQHVIISGNKALDFAQDHGLTIEDQGYFESELRYKQLQKAIASNSLALDHDEEEENKFGTVGAVALDQKGNLAAGTSTGGLVNKKHGRIGDSPLIGIGTYANNESCAISCTGHGEFFIRKVVAHEVSSRMIYKKESLDEATQKVVMEDLKSINGLGGLIAIDKSGNISMPFNTSGMFRGFKKSNGEEFVGIF